MALVDYSDSDSDSETVTQQAPPPAPSAPTAPAQTNASRQPVQKVVDRANPRKILVNLPGTSKSDESSSTTRGGEEPSTQRARTTGCGAFSGFASFLPPPKNAGKATPAASSAAKTAPRRPGINLKTGATPGFSRSADLNNDEDGERSTSQQQSQPTIPAGQKPADEVKLVGKPMMFKPLSVSRKPVKKKNTFAKTTAATTTTKAGLTTEPFSQMESQPAPESAEPPKKKKKTSLFSIAQEEPADIAPSPGAYEPMFATTEGPAETNSAAAFAAYDAQHGGGDASSYPNLATSSSSASLNTLAAGMNLSKAARRELFGRSGAPPDLSSAGAPSVIDFNTDKEYAHNEELRASGEQQTFNPVRAIAPGKHSLRQLVTQVHNQRDALEESFAKGKSNQREAGSRYGWR